MAELDYRKYWDDAFSWADYLENEVREHRDLWLGVWARSSVPQWARDQAARLGAGWKLLVISEDWCGDASNTVPVVARLGEIPGFEVRVVKRDENAELMDAYLTSGSRSIPLVVVLGPDFAPVGRWGPRPADLQTFVLREKAAGERPVPEIYREVRQWYARDRGETTLREVLAVVGGDTARAAA